MIKLLTKTDKNVTSFWVSFPLCTRTLPPSLHPTHTSPLPPAYTYTRSLPHTLSLLCVSHTPRVTRTFKGEDVNVPKF